MANHCAGAVLLLGFLLSFVVSVCWASAAHSLTVEGRVYCDACAAGHLAPSSFYLAGAKVAVQCGSRQHVTAYSEGKSDEQGRFAIAMEGEHEGETCMALLLHSPHPSCNLLSGRAFATIFLTSNVINTGPFSFQPSRVSSSACAREHASRDDSGD